MTTRRNIRRVAVLGAGTMGAQIAALIASKGVACDLFDMRSDGSDPNGIVEQARARLLTLRPPALESCESLDLIHPGNFTDDLPRLAQADWVIEAIVEKLEPKRQLWASAAPHLRPGVIVSTNTSGIPIAEIAKAFPTELRQRFLGTHFFNPPRYLKLLEIIPTSETEPSAIEEIRRFAEDVLDKGVVAAHDVPGFITNRIGLYYFLAALRAAEQFGLTPDEVDAITGPVMGRPNSATYRTLDLVGLDVFVDICDNMQADLTESWERKAYEAPPYMREMLNREGRGEKSGQGFYKRVREDGESRILTLNTHSMEYGPRQRIQSPLLNELGGIEDVSQRILRLVNVEETAGRFAWRIISELLVYSARKVGEVADDIVSIDRALRWGFNWSLGPFETWDALGVAASVSRMRDDGPDLPAWVVELADKGQGFYRKEGDRLLQITPQATYIPIP